MYEDDLSDLLPQRHTVLPSFNDDVDDPFKNPFSDGTDPWATQPTAGGFGDWNTNAFADEPSHNISSLPQDPIPISPESPTASRKEDLIAQKEDIISPSQHEERPPAIHAETPVVENVAPAAPSTAVVDPLDAALSNVEEPPEHIPVFKRKLPLIISDQPTTPDASASPAAKTEQKDKDSETETPEANEDANKVATTPLATPTQTTEERPSDTTEPGTPTLSKSEPSHPPDSPPKSSSEELPTLPQPTLEIPSSTPDTSFSIENQITPPHSLTREQSTSDIDGKLSLDKVAISPLERTPAMLPNPLDKTYTAPPPLSLGGEMGVGGWGDGWNAGPSSGNFYTAPNMSAQPEQSPTHGEEAIKEREEEDPEDNIPLAHSLPKAPIPMYTITVGDPQKVGDPISAHIIYTVHTKTTNPNYKKSQFSVLRRYSDFVWLFDTLCNNNPGVIVPPIPEKNSFGRFQEEFVAARRLALNKCLQKMANHPGLCNDKDLQLFLESDNFSLDIKHRRAEENTGLLSMFSSSITGTKFYETDEWFETKKAYLDGLENQLKGLVRSMEAVAKQRAESSQALSELAETLEAVSTADISKQLSNAFSRLAIVQRKAKELQDEQAQQDVVTFAGTVEEYGRMIGSVRLAFGSRIKCFNQWQNADNDLRRVKTNYDRAKKQSKTPERLHYFMQEVADAERKATHTKSEFERVTKLLKIELHRFDMERVEDFKRSLEAFLDGMIRRQKDLITSWEEYQSTLLRRSETNFESDRAEGDEESSAVTSAA
ncbi:Vps5-domain-containing protein [Serendipita vermifera]|nr:Vps5-domain-containing protein [Serendipita vermifera]